MAGRLAPVLYWAVCATLCSALRSEAEQLPYQIDGAAVELIEGPRTHAKSFQSPEGE